MTNQEMFDKTWAHLVKQGRPARLGDVCQYRAPDGTKCAAGIFIPDEKYKKEMEGCYIDKVIDMWLPELGEHSGLLCDLQKIHDNCDLTDSGSFNLTWLKFYFDDAAKFHDLKPIELIDG